MQIVIDITEEDYENVSQSNFTVLTREKKAHLINRVLSKVAEGTVLPAHKVGKWIKHESNMTCEDVDNFYDEDWDGTTYECSSCHATYFYRYDFCPNCGTKMED